MPTRTEPGRYPTLAPVVAVTPDRGPPTVGGTRFDRAAALVAIIGAVAVVVANLVAAWLHPETGLFADTISNLAAGRYHWVLDIALVLFGLGMIAVAFGMWTDALDDRWHWHLGTLLIGLAGLGVIVIALWNEYGDGEAGGVTIHLEVVIGLAVAFTLGSWLVAPGLSRVGTYWAALSVWLGIFWLVAGLAYFFLAPDSLDGLIERIAAVAMVVWLVSMARFIARVRPIRR